MTTIDGTVTLTGLLAHYLGAKARRSQAARMNRVYVGTWVALVRLTLHVAGFSCLTYAAFLWHMIAGFSVAGILCLVLSSLLTGKANPQTDNRR